MRGGWELGVGHVSYYQDSANWGPNSRFVIEAISKPLVSNSTQSLILKTKIVVTRIPICTLIFINACIKRVKNYIFETTLKINSRNNSTSKYKQFLTLNVRSFSWGIQQYFRVQFSVKQSSIPKLEFLSATYIHPSLLTTILCHRYVM